MSSLEQVLESVTREATRKKAKLTRRFIVTEGLFENDGFISDLEKLVSLFFELGSIEKEMSG